MSEPLSGVATDQPVGHDAPRPARRRMGRRLPRWKELRPYLRSGPIRLSPIERRLAGAATIADLRSVARRHTPRAVFDYVDGAAEAETSMRRSRDVWIRDAWAGQIVIKGIQAVDDARAVAHAGVDGVIVSNHGGRQLDCALTPLEQLPHIVEAVGDRLEVYVDGGVMNGADVVAVVAAMGARAACVGRAYLYGLMAGGERGVARAGELLQEATRTMRLPGATRVTDLSPDKVRLRPAGCP